jgi:circadian clock protein KaiB
MGTANKNGSVEKNSTEDSKARIVSNKRLKDDLQPYVGSDLCSRLSQNLDNWIFFCPVSHIDIMDYKRLI